MGWLLFYYLSVQKMLFRRRKLRGGPNDAPGLAAENPEFPLVGCGTFCSTGSGWLLQSSIAHLEVGSHNMSHRRYHLVALAVAGLVLGVAGRLTAADHREAPFFVGSYFVSPADAVEMDPGKQPDLFKLSANYPNPFNPTTTIEFTLAEATDVELSVFNVRGELINTLVKENRRAGGYSLQWDGTNLNHQQVSSGVYLYRLKAENFEETRRMLLIR